MSLFSNTIHLLENSINYSNTKQKVISQNIANVDTPNYKAKEVLPFKKVLENERANSISSKITNDKHIMFTSTAGTKQILNPLLKKMLDIMKVVTVWIWIKKWLN